MVSHAKAVQALTKAVVGLCCLLVLLPTSHLLAAPSGYSEFYIPGDEDLMFEIFDIISDQDEATDTANGGMHVVIALTAWSDQTTVYYDHWEDGYEFDPNSPSSADETYHIRWSGSTQDYTTNEIITFQDSGVVLPRGTAASCDVTTPNAADPGSTNSCRYDGRDQIFVAGGTATVSRAGWIEDRGTVLSVAWEVYPVRPQLTAYILPFGEELTRNPSYYDDFDRVFALVQATEDGTVVEVDYTGDGSPDPLNTDRAGGFEGASVSLDKGEVFLLSREAINDTTSGNLVTTGTRITANKTLQVQYVIGDENSGYEVRGLSAFPRGFWDKSYYIPVDSPAAATGDPGDAFFYNPHSAPLTIRYETTTTSGSFSVPAKSTRSYYDGAGAYLPEDSAVYLSANDVFWGVVTIDTEAQVHDWAHSLVPASLLADEHFLAWAPGSYPVGNYDDSGLYVAAAQDHTLLFVDYGNGQPAERYSLNRYDTVYLYDSEDGDMSQAHIWSTGAYTAAYGQNPDTAAVGNPALDMGYTIIPDTNFLDIVLGLDKTVDPATLPTSAGQTSVVTLRINSGLYSVDSLQVLDVLPPGWRYKDNDNVVITWPDGSTTTGSTATPTFIDYLDTFNTTAYDNDESTPSSVAWTTDWNEAGDDDNAGSRTIQVVADTVPDPDVNALRIEGSDNDSIARMADLSGFANAMLSLEYRRENLDHSSDEVEIQVCKDASDGADISCNDTDGWTTLATVGAGPADDSGYTRLQLDLEGYDDSATFALRLRENGIETGEYIHFRNIRISETRWDNLGDMEENQALTIQFTAETTQAFNSGDITRNSATVTGTRTVEGITQTFVAEDSAFHQFTDSHMAITKTSDVTTAASPGDTITYTVEVENDGSGALTNLSLYDSIPTGTSYVSNSSTLEKYTGAPLNWTTLEDPAGTPPNFVNSGDNQTIEEGERLRLTFQVTVDDPFPSGQTDIKNIVEARAAQLILPITADVTDPVVIPATKTAIVGDRVWLDENGNGVLDVGEKGIGNVEVTLKDEYGTPLKVTTTDTLGRYLFTGVAYGYNYYVEVTNGLPAGLTQVAATGGNDRTASFDLYGPATITDLGNNADNFDAASYAYDNSDGSEDWTTYPWVETEGGAAGPSDGDIRITGGELRINNRAHWNEGAGESSSIERRLVIPADANKALLTFDYRSDGVLETNDEVYIQISGDGGSSYTTLASYAQDVNGSASFELGAYLGSDTRIRFSTNEVYGGIDEFFYVDNVTIAYSSETAQPIDEYLDADLGYQFDSGTATFGDLIWSDADGDDFSDPGEVGLGGIAVELWRDMDGDGIFEPTGDDADQDTGTTGTQGPQSTASTDNGAYIFSGVAASGTEDYFVTVDTAQAPLSGWTSTGFTASAGGTTYAYSYYQDVDAGTVKLNADFGFNNDSGTSTIKDRIWYDIDTDGNDDNNASDDDNAEAGIEAVTVVLMDGNGEIVSTTVISSANNGEFEFVGVPNGDRYTIEITDTNGNLAGYYPTTDGASARAWQMPGVLTGDVDYSSESSGDRDDGASEPHFGFARTRSIGDTVFTDNGAGGGIAGNGVQDGTEPGIAGVTVNLYVDIDSDGDLLDGETITDTATTNSSGNYLFSGLTDGTDYIVSVVTPANYNSSPGTADSDSATPGAQQPSSFTSGSSDLDRDFGYVVSTGYSISGTVWENSIENASQDIGEDPFEYVTVELWSDPDGDGDLSDATEIASSSTDLNGNYAFDALDANSGSERYVVVVTDASGQLSGYATNYEVTEGVGAGSYDQKEVIHLDGTDRVGIDFGFFVAAPPAGTREVSGTVYRDEANDETLDGDESTGIANVVVRLYADPDGDGDYADSALVAITTTDGNGDYSFGDLAAAPYVVVESDPSGYHSVDDVSADGIDTDNAIAVYLTSGNATDRDFLDTSPYAAIGDRVWLDLDSDGVQDIGEPGIGGVTISLLNHSGGDLSIGGVLYGNGDVIATTITDASGEYRFSDLPASTYQVDLTDLGIDGVAATGDERLRNLAAAPGVSDPHSVSVGDGEFYEDADFGYVPDDVSAESAIGGVVWHDHNDDGRLESAENGIGEVTLTLFDLGDDGIYGTADDTVTATTTAYADGGYLFTDVPAGAYVVVVDDSNDDLSGDPLFGLSPTQGPDSEGGPISDPISVTPGFSDYGTNFGYNDGTPSSGHTLTDRVWYDTDGDGNYEPNGADGLPNTADDEFALANVGIDLYEDSDGNGVASYAIVDGRVDLNGSGSGIGDNGAVNGIAIRDGKVDLDGDGTADDSGEFLGYPLVNGELDLNGSGTITGDGADDGSLTYERVINTVRTNSAGLFAFDGLIDGEDYVVGVGDADGVLADLDPTTVRAINGEFGATNVTANIDNSATPSFGYNRLYAISGVLWNDADGNGLIDAGESILPGMTVERYDATGTLLHDIAITGPDGRYRFDGLGPNDYVIKVKGDGSNPATAPSDYPTATGDPDESGTCSTCDNQALLTLTAGGGISGVDFGYRNTALADISGTVFEDGNQNGVHDASESGIPGVALDLRTLAIINGQIDFNLDGAINASDDGGYAGYTVVDGILSGADGETLNGMQVINGRLDVDGDGVTDNGGSGGDPDDDFASRVLASTTADGNGDYRFPDLIDGEYAVHVTDTGKVLDGYTLSSGLDEIQPISIGDGNASNGNTGMDVTDVDFGYVRDTGSSSISGTTWLDGNGNGVQGSGEAILSGIEVTLIEAGNDGVLGSDDDVTVATITTDAKGDYSFLDLEAGKYQVEIGSGVPANLSQSGDPDEPGSCATCDEKGAINLAENQDARDVDFGYGPDADIAVLGDRVWYDADGDGIQDSGESGIGGVTVNIYSKLDGSLVTSVTTDADGAWLATFTEDATADEYMVKVDADTLPGGVIPTPTNMDGGDTYIVSVGAGDVRTNLDFGYDGGVSGSIGDEVFIDANDNGGWDAGEGLSGVTLFLSSVEIINGEVDVDGDGQITTDDDGLYGGYAVADGVLEANAVDQTINGITVLSGGRLDVNADGSIQGTDDQAALILNRTTTDANGKYIFSGLPAGDYRVSVGKGLPSGLTRTVGVDPSSVITLASGSMDYPTADFGYRPDTDTAVIGDRVWSDASGEGDQDAGEVGIGGVSVRLCDTANCDNRVFDTTTNADGSYRFSNVAATGTEDYFVVVTTPTGYSTTPTNNAGQVSHGLTDLASGSVINTADWGFDIVDRGASIGDRVYADNNGDGDDEGGGDSGITGIEVNLYDNADNLIATTRTGTSGGYDFTGLPAGTYRVEINDIDNDLASKDPTEVSGASITVAANEDYNDADFGFTDAETGTGVIGDIVYYDADGDGATEGYETGEVGLVDVTLNLVDCVNDTCGDGDDKVVASTTTSDGNLDVDGDGNPDPIGSYRFDGLEAGKYKVVVTDNNSVLDDLTATQAQDAITIGCDSAGSCDQNLTVDLGYQSLSGGNGTLGGTLWHDADSDGYQADPESGIQGVTINLWLDNNGDGVIDPGSDNLVRSETTNANGDYRFLALPPGSYIIDQTDTSSVLDGFSIVDIPDTVDNGSSIDPDGGSNGTADQDEDRFSHDDVYAVSLTLDEVDTSVDFGYEATTAVSISGVIFEDDGDSLGAYNDPASGGDDAYVPGATIKLYRILGGVEYLIGVTASTINGSYAFTNLPSGGDYRVKVDITGTLAEGMQETFDADATDNGEDCGTCNSQWSVTDLTSPALDVDFGYWNGGVVTTPITLSFFHASEGGELGLITFEWQTATEVGHVGFYLYGVNADGQRVRLGDFIVSEPGDSHQTRSYRLTLEGVSQMAFYLGDLAVTGKETLHGPFVLGDVFGAQAAEPDWIDWQGIAQESSKKGLKRSSEKQQRLSDRLRVKRSRVASGDTRAPQPLTTKSLPLTDPGLMQFKVDKAGVYRVTYEALKENGLDLLDTDPSLLGLTSQGEPVAMRVTSSTSSATLNFGPGWYLEFIGEPLDSLYTRTNVYTLDLVGGGGARIEQHNAAPDPGASPASYYLASVALEPDVLYSFSSPTGDPWYAASILANGRAAQKDLSLSIDDYAGPVAPVRLGIDVWGGIGWPEGGDDHHLLTLFNGEQVDERWFDGIINQPFTTELPEGLLREGDNTLTLKLPLDTGHRFDMINLEGYQVTYPRRFLSRDGKGLRFTGRGARFEVKGLADANIRVYRQDKGEWRALTDVAIEEDGQGGYQVGFGGLAESDAEYLVTTLAGIATPAMEVPPEIGDAISGEADYLIIAHPDFIDGSLDRLVQARQADGLRVKVVATDTLYTQFGYGIWGADAIRRYIRYAWENLGVRWVLLVGGDTVDYHDYYGYGGFSFLPSIYAQTDETVVRFAPVDPLYADVSGDDGIPDLAIGRFPVRTSAELEMMVDKTLSYAAGAGQARSSVFASDVYDAAQQYDFHEDVLEMMKGLPAAWRDEATHLSIDVLGLAEAKAELMGQINSGVALTTFVGHSAQTQWSLSSGGALLTSNEAAQFTNSGEVTLVSQWGCWNNWHVAAAANTMAHRFLLSGDQGAAAVLGSATLSDGNHERVMGKGLYEALFEPGRTIGEAMTLAKQAYAQAQPADADVLLGWTLLGDPALMMEPAVPVGELDSDGDGLPDAWEEENGLSIIKDDASLDLDGDGLTSLEEYQRGTDGLDNDSDGDGLLDGWDSDPVTTLENACSDMGVYEGDIYKIVIEERTYRDLEEISCRADRIEIGLNVVCKPGAKVALVADQIRFSGSGSRVESGCLFRMTPTQTANARSHGAVQ
jgi:uncharacterized repeat protein (TIGR01451 family)